VEALFVKLRALNSMFERLQPVLKRELEVIGSVGGIATAQVNIAVAKTQCERGNIEEILKASQDVYKLCVAQYGEENESTIHADKVYAVNLQKANHGKEAREIFTSDCMYPLGRGRKANVVY
jgi:hypothetical protein